MEHTYQITGMSCNGCRGHVEKILSEIDGITKVTVDLDKAEAVVEMKSHLSINELQQAFINDGGSYDIHLPGEASNPKKEIKRPLKTKKKGEFYCPMHCEGDKIYDKPGDCPVCGMDLVSLEADISAEDQNYQNLLKKFRLSADYINDCVSFVNFY